MPFGDGGERVGFNVDQIFAIIGNATKAVKTKMDELKDAKDNISIQHMFEMQMLMNHLAQLSEMSTNVIAASNTAISSMARNVKS